MPLNRVPPYIPGSMKRAALLNRLAMAAVVLLLVGCVAASGDEDTITSVPGTTTASEPTTTTSEPTTTMALPPSETVLVIGDWGSGNGDMDDVATAMQRYASSTSVEAILTTGDNLYSDDYPEILASYGWAKTDGIPFWITWGNHDEDSPSRVAAVDEAFGNPAHWTTIRWGETDIIILDSNAVDSGQQLSFLKEQMATISRPTIMVFHHPAYSCSTHGSTDAVLEEWLPIFDDDVILALSGHDHNYQRFESSGVTYVVTGGGGRGTYELDPCTSEEPTRLVAVETNHFLAMSQDASGIDVTAIDSQGNIIDKFMVPFPG
jgi:predicted phosphodiesterase